MAAQAVAEHYSQGQLSVQTQRRDQYFSQLRLGQFPSKASGSNGFVPARTPVSPPDSGLMGMLLYAISTIFMTGMTICAKLLGQQGIPVFEMVLARSFIVLAFALVPLWTKGINPLGHNRLLLTFRGACGFCAASTLYWSVNLLPLSDAMVLTFLAPLVVAALGPLMLKEPPTKAALLALPLCMVGVVLIARPPLLFAGATAVSATGIIVGCIQPVFSAVAKMCVRKLRSTEETYVIVFYMGLISTLGAAFFCVVLPGDFVVPHNWTQVGLLFGVGVTGFLSQLLLTEGLRRVNAVPATAMQYLSVIWGLLAGIFLFHEVPTWVPMGGVALISVSTLGLALSMGQNKEVKIQGPGEGADVEEPLLLHSGSGGKPRDGGDGSGDVESRTVAVTASARAPRADVNGIGAAAEDDDVEANAGAVPPKWYANAWAMLAPTGIASGTTRQPNGDLASTLRPQRLFQPSALDSAAREQSAEPANGSASWWPGFSRAKWKRSDQHLDAQADEEAQDLLSRANGEQSRTFAGLGGATSR